MLLICVLCGALAVQVAAAPSAPQHDFEPRVPPRNWNSIVLHHSATAEGDVASIDAVHRRQRDPSGKPWLGIGYHFVVGNGQKMGDGEVQPTFRWHQQLPGAHAGLRDYNERGIGICLIGNFEQSVPTAKQLAAARALVKTLAERYAISRKRVVRHQDVHSTACPGRFFPMSEVVGDVPATASGAGRVPGKS
jgi:N-acetyl-anhydromuramyl-L-alanine amidase AmpD